jgi:glycosyltransferase involved in cell wall biosynthesis
MLNETQNHALQHNQRAIYGEDYYRYRFGPIPYERNSHWLDFFCGIAEKLVHSLRPKTVFDAGCGWGLLVEAFRERGVKAYGCDVSEYAISQVPSDIRDYCVVASVTRSISGGPYDLVTCIEVLEHIEEQDARSTLEAITRVTDCIVFSSTATDFTEPTHVNVRPPIYWLRAFAELGFYPDLGFDASFIAPQAFLVRRCSEPMEENLLHLFAEILGYRIDRTAFLQRQTRIEELERESVQLGLELRQSAGDAAKYAEERGQLRSEIRILSLDRAQRAAEIIDLQSRLEVSGKQVVDIELQFVAARGQLADMRRDLTTSLDELREARGRLFETNEELRQTRGSTSSLTREIVERRREAEVEVSRQKQSQALISELECRVASAEQRAERAEYLFDEWRSHCEDLSRSLEQLCRRNELVDAQLESIARNPGWRFILQCRDWLKKNRWRRPWVRKHLEPAIRGLFQRVLPPAPVLAVPSFPSIPSITEATARPKAEIILAPTGRLETSTDYAKWIKESEPNAAMLNVQRRMSACLSYRPKISVLVPVYKVTMDILKAMVESVAAQTYENWELCLSVPSPDNPEAARYLDLMASRDSRIRVVVLDRNEGISENSNRALSLASGEYLALLDHDDLLAPFALFEVARLLNQDREINFIYSDKDLISEDGKRRFQPLFKPQWSPDTMLNANYLTHLCVMRTVHIRDVGGWRRETDGAQDWDLFFRVIQRFGKVRHIPQVLYHWRQINSSVAQRGLDAKPYAVEGQERAVRYYCATLGLKAEVLRDDSGDMRIKWPIQKAGKVSIVYVSTKWNGEMLQQANQLLSQTDYPDFEIIFPYGEVEKAGTLKCISTPPQAGLKQRIEAAVREATGETLVFIDEGVTPASPEWLRELVGPMQLDEVGMVGARLVDERTQTLRHCGLVFTEDGRLEYLYAGQPEHVYEQFGGAAWYRNWSAVSGACFAIRRSLWERLNGMEGPLSSRLDVHLGLKTRLHSDLRIVYNPYARLMQIGEAALERPLLQGPSAGEALRAQFAAGDPYFNPNLDCHRGKIGYRAIDGRQPIGTDYAAHSRALLEIYDFTPSQLRQSQQGQLKHGSGKMETVTWFLPEFNNPFYGGIHTILRFASTFQTRYKVRSLFCIFGHSPEKVVRQRIAATFPSLETSNIVVLDDHRRVNELPESDAAVCSLWTTAYALLQFQNARRKFYFVQDDESRFYPAGSTSALVEASYGFGFYGICNTISLSDRYSARGGDAEYFNPCIDSTVFHDRNRKTIDAAKPYTIFCYARPDHPRNCFELLAAVLRNLKQRLGDKILLITAGAEWDWQAHGLEGIVVNLGLLDYQMTGALYRMCDAGLVMMMTRHPSYLPLELMACGSLVITNRNPDTAWLLKDGENCLLADPSPTSLTERVIEGLKDLDLRRRITNRAREQVNATYNNWNNPIDKIYKYMVSKC